MLRELFDNAMTHYEPLCAEDLDDKYLSGGRQKDRLPLAWKYIAMTEMLVIAIMFLVAFHLSNRCKPPVCKSCSCRTYVYSLPKTILLPKLLFKKQPSTKHVFFTVDGKEIVPHSKVRPRRQLMQLGMTYLRVRLIYFVKVKGLNIPAGTLFRITKEEELLLPNRTTPIPGDISHYAASLSVVHHLHCIVSHVPFHTNPFTSYVDINDDRISSEKPCGRNTMGNYTGCAIPGR
jgi:hypothetical protein